MKLRKALCGLALTACLAAPAAADEGKLKVDLTEFNMPN